MRSTGLDEYVATIVRDGVAVRRLELLISPLESMFFSLTTDEGSTGPEAWIAAQAEARAEETVTS